MIERLCRLYRKRGPSRTLRAARYHRVSRVDQTPALQVDETEAFIVRRGWVGTAVYEDVGISGAKGRRCGLDELLADARRRRWDVLVVYRADRLFRSVKEMVNVLDELSELGVAFVSCSEPFDTTVPSGKLLLHLVSAMAEFERGILIERTRAGIQAAKRRGVRCGRALARIDHGELLELHAQGFSVRQIASRLGFGSSTIQRHLLAARVAS